MATTTDALLSDDRGTQYATGERAVRFVAVRADLMPPEVATSRAADQMRRNVLIGLATVVAVLALAFGFSWWQTHSARSDLAAQQAKGVALNSQTEKYAPLVQAQSRTAEVHAELAQLMTGDLSWRDLLIKLRAAAPAETALTQVTGSVEAADTTQTVPLGTTGVVQAGTLTLTGTARSKAEVAAYADRLSIVKGLAAATPTTVTAGSTGATGAASHNAGVTFTMSVVITSDALGGRFAALAPTPATTSTTSTTGGN